MLPTNNQPAIVAKPGPSKPQEDDQSHPAQRQLLHCAAPSPLCAKEPRNCQQGGEQPDFWSKSLHNVKQIFAQNEANWKMKGNSHELWRNPKCLFRGWHEIFLRLVVENEHAINIVPSCQKWPHELRLTTTARQGHDRLLFWSNLTFFLTLPLRATVTQEDASDSWGAETVTWVGPALLPLPLPLPFVCKALDSVFSGFRFFLPVPLDESDKVAFEPLENPFSGVTASGAASLREKRRPKPFNSCNKFFGLLLNKVLQSRKQSISIRIRLRDDVTFLLNFCQQTFEAIQRRSDWLTAPHNKPDLSTRRRQRCLGKNWRCMWTFHLLESVFVQPVATKTTSSHPMCCPCCATPSQEPKPLTPPMPWPSVKRKQRRKGRIKGRSQRIAI